MEKSDIFNQSQSIEFILSETELFGRSCELTPPEAMRLRLLAEETLSLTVRLFEHLTYTMQVENTKKRFAIILDVATLVDSDQKDKVLSLSSKGKNKATGILGKISDAFSSLLINNTEAYQFGGTYDSHYNEDNKDTLFSLKYYKNSVKNENKKPEWDGLEKSIIAHYADDVTIGVKSDKVEVIATIIL